MMSMAAATVNAPAMNRPSSLVGDQYLRRCYFVRQVRRSLLQLRCACSSPLPCFPVALKKSESRVASTASSAGDDNDDSAFSLLTAVTSRYNEIVVLDTPKGAGTAAHLMLDLWPSCHIKGWEIDEILINIAREYFSLSDLESCTQAGGSLSIHIGDAFSPAAVIEGGFAGIVVDLFSGGKILPQLSEIATWLEIEKKLMPHGRIMVNCGGAHTESHAEIADSGYIKVNESNSSKGYWVQNSTIKAMCRAFPGKVSWKRMENGVSENYLALTGLVPDLDGWSAALPHPLNMNVKHWRPCEFHG